MNKERAVKIIVLLVLLLLITTTAIYLIFYSWGGKGEMSLYVQLENEEFRINGSCELNYTLTNSGNSVLRVFFPFWYVPSNMIIIYNDQHDIIRTRMEWEPPPEPNGDDLVTLKPGESVSRSIMLSNELYFFETNTTYNIMGKYIVMEMESIHLPYWRGELFSDIIQVTITE